jgi:hypothetical protein
VFTDDARLRNKHRAWIARVDEVVYKNATYRWLGWVSILVVVVFGLAFAAAIASPWSVVPILVALPAIWIVYRSYVSAAVRANAGGIVIVNPTKTVRLGWDEISRIEALFKLRVTATDGRVVDAWAVQAANVARMTGRRSYADDVAEALNLRLAAMRGEAGLIAEPVSDLDTSRARSWMRRQSFAIAAGCLLACAVLLFRELQ